MKNKFNIFTITEIKTNELGKRLEEHGTPIITILGNDKFKKGVENQIEKTPPAKGTYLEIGKIGEGSERKNTLIRKKTLITKIDTKITEIKEY